MDRDTILLLAAEIVYKHGGYYVPLSCLYSPAEEPVDGCGLPETRELARWNSVIAAPKQSTATLRFIKKYYDTGILELPFSIISSNANVVSQGFDDSVVAYVDFPTGSRFLGASEIYFSAKKVSTQRSCGCIHSALTLAYDFQVPIRSVDDGDLTGLHASTQDLRKILVTDADVALLPNLFDTIPGFIHRAGQDANDWDFILIGVEWDCGVNEEALHRSTSHIRGNPSFFAVVLNNFSARYLPESFDSGSEVVDSVLRLSDQARVMTGVVRFAESEKATSLYQSMSVVASVFQRICGHTIPPWHCDHREFQGNLLKGTRQGQLAYELCVDDERRVMYRAFNDNGGLNCEIKLNQGMGGRHVVDYARVFYDHAVVFDGQQIAL